MATWGEILTRLQDNQDFDGIRREALSDLTSYTDRPTILYASCWLQKNAGGNMASITHDDIEGFMEALYGISDSSLDLILHSPGGQAEAAEAIVEYLRNKFTHIRVFVPQMAMSAATMLTCAANEVVLGRHSSLGPIDPQLSLPSLFPDMLIPAQAILDQFERAKQECAQNPQHLAVWVPILQQYGPALLEQCSNAMELAKSLVKMRLSRYMFQEDPQRDDKASKIAAFLANHKEHLTHGRPLNFARLEGQGMVVRRLEADQGLQDRILTVYHATMHTFSGTSAAKIIENHTGKGMFRLLQPVHIPKPPEAPPVDIPDSE